MRDVDPQRALQVMPYVAHRHPARIQRDDHLVQAAADPPLALGHQPRLERRVTVPRGVQLHRADLAPQRLRGRPVVGVRAAPPGRVALLVTEVIGQLDLQPAFEHRLDHLRQEPARPGQPQHIPVHRLQQPVQKRLVQQLRTQRPRRRHLVLRRPIPIRHRTLTATVAP